jgi:mono/diheme cytochrome c family protein
MPGKNGQSRVVSWLSAAVTAYSLWTGYSPSAAAADPIFERRVKPILTANCVRCHAGRKIKGGLDLSTRGKLLLGGDSGPAVVAGKPADSLLIEVLGDGTPHMPPKKQLPPAAIAELTKWVGGLKATDVPAGSNQKATPRKRREHERRGKGEKRRRHRERENDDD